MLSFRLTVCESCIKLMPICYRSSKGKRNTGLLLKVKILTTFANTFLKWRTIMKTNTMSNHRFVNKFFSCLVIGIFLCCNSVCAMNPLPEFQFRQLLTLNGLQSNDVQQLYQDKDGFIWIGTRMGLFQYDGYTIKTFKSNLYNQNLLNDNNIFSMVEDANHRLWIGTFSGLNMLDKTTGEIHQVNKNALRDNSVSVILPAKDGRILLGTDKGLFQYLPEQDSCVVYGRHNTGNILPQTSIKSLFEDSKNNIWIGTWNEGLYRYDPNDGKYYYYPKMNARNSAHVVFEDSRNRIWVGTWNEGLFLLENPYKPEEASWRAFKHSASDPHSLLDNIIYAISEDPNTHSLWVGTRSGLSILSGDKELSIRNYVPDDTGSSISGNEVSDIICDNQGMMWLGMVGGGVNTVITRKPSFNLERLDAVKRELTSNSVRSLLVDKDGLVWIGIGTYGLVVQNRKDGTYIPNSRIDDFPSNGLPTILTMMQSSRTGKIWVGTYDGGIYVYDKAGKAGEKVKRYTVKDTPWLSSDCVYSIKEDYKGNIWIGTKYGISLLKPNGIGVRLSALNLGGKDGHLSVVSAFADGEDGTVWAATGNNGVVRIKGDGDKVEGYQIKSYSFHNQKLNSSNAICLYKDKENRIWAGTEGSGLNLYDADADQFVPVHKEWNLPGDAVSTILEDLDGNLWMGTNVGLIKLDLKQGISKANYRLFTVSDGLQDNIFNRNAAFVTADGEMLFGGHKGYNSFYPEQMIEQEGFLPVAITDIKIFNTSWSALDKEVRDKISKNTPEFTKEIVLDYQHNNFSIEFSALGYANPAQNKYAYKLEGFDTKWQYTDADRRFAYYNNLKAGTYTFLLKATNPNGAWNEKTISLQVVILPAPWLTWWACVVYVLITIGIGVMFYRTMRNRLRLRNALHLRELEQAKSEELNHLKLQFFTNITHELLTPLTIISASVDELKICAPQNGEYYQVMTNNINRLIRLLQQILEFRKAETGNLKLKVSKGDLSAFVRNSVESFRPLMKKRKMNFSVSCLPEPFPAYFDSDKLDKILYNLLSNASKYNDTGGTVWVDLSYDEPNGKAVLVVKDNGQGISQEAQKTLFKRFYEGDYRKFQTIGTGIGLSLTKDLVVLHGGVISVESEPGQGTQFKVVFSVLRESYKEEEIDDAAEARPLAQQLSEDGNEQEPEQSGSKEHSLLLIEDNEELLHLMVKLLSTDYNVFTANNGKEGIEFIESEDAVVDLVVSDVMMPEMNGIDFCKYVKSNFDTCHIPVILLTAKNREEDRVEAYDSGADAFISKPFNLSVLHARINNLLKARERANRDFKKQLVFEAKELNYTSIDEDFLQRAIDCVHRHLDDSEFDQPQFVDEMGTSKSTLFRKLKSLTGLSYSSFIRNIRLKAACQIMEEKKHIRISELAYAVGFNDPKYFSACFKREFGMQPSEYLERFILGERCAKSQ